MGAFGEDIQIAVIGLTSVIMEIVVDQEKLMPVQADHVMLEVPVHDIIIALLALHAVVELVVQVIGAVRLIIVAAIHDIRVKNVMAAIHAVFQAVLLAVVRVRIVGLNNIALPVIVVKIY